MCLLRLEFALVFALFFGPPVIDMWPAIVGAWPPDMLTFKYWQQGGTNTSRSEVARNLGLIAAAVVGIGIASWRAYTAYLQTAAAQQQAKTASDQVRIAEQGQFTDRFAKAVELLGDKDRVMVRIGAVYALGRIARDSIELDHIAVMQVLCQFVRHSPYAATQETITVNYDEDFKSHIEEGGPEPEVPSTQECPDILAALEVISQRSELQKDWEKQQDYSPSLAYARLSWLELRDAKFCGAGLGNAFFRGANLWDADFEGAKLIGANFSSASLSLANLTGADCIFAEFNSASLTATNLTNADMSLTNLSHANFDGANLNGTHLNHAKLDNANFGGASNLTQEQIDAAKVDEDRPPILPDDLHLPTKTPSEQV